MPNRKKPILGYRLTRDWRMIGNFLKYGISRFLMTERREWNLKILSALSRLGNSQSKSKVKTWNAKKVTR